MEYEIDTASALAQRDAPLTPSAALLLATLLRAHCSHAESIVCEGSKETHIVCRHPGGPNYRLDSLFMVAHYLKAWMD